MKKKMQNGILVIMVLWGFLGREVYADSSWIWLSERRPYELLPIAVVMTIFIEVVMLVIFLKIRNIKKTVLIVTIGNALSFIIPYAFNYFMLRTDMGYESIERAFSTGPYYMVGLGYLFLTIIIELPVVYAGLKNEITDKKRGIFVICIANTVTTILVFVMERIACYGQW